MSGQPTIDESMRRTLAGLADVLLPEADGMPAASDAGVHAEWLDRVLEVRPDLGRALVRVLTEAAGREPRAEIERLRQESPASLADLAMAVAGAYYLKPDVRGLIGYPGQEPSLPEPGEYEHDLRDGILDPVVARGPVYRPTP